MTDTLERLKLIQTLSAFPPAEFEMILTALKPPPGVVPSSAAEQGMRTTAFVNWVEGPTGPGLLELQQLLAHYTGNPR